MPKEDCPLNDESILFIFTLFLLFDSSENVLFTKSSSVNSSENIELNVSLLLEFLRRLIKDLENINNISK